MAALPHAQIISESMPNGSQRVVSPLTDVTLELAIMGYGVLCLVVASFIGLKVVKLILGVIGLVLTLVGVTLLALKLSVRRLQSPSSRSKVRTCVWALSSFGDLLAGSPAALSIEVVNATQRAGSAAGARPTVGDFPQPAFAHEPRLEQTACPCCLQDFAHETRVAVIRCGHIFCETCLRTWAAADRGNGGACPLCRVSFELEEA